MEIHRNTLYYLFIVAMLPAFYKCTTNAPTPKYSHLACHGNGQITLTVKDPVQSVVSNCTSGSHSVTVSQSNKTVTIDNCPLNSEVTILMLEDTIPNGVDAEIDSRRVGEAIAVMCNGTGLQVNTSNINAPVTFKPVSVPYHETLTMTLLAIDDITKQSPVDTITVGGSYTLQINASK
ncbi:uncharacterized protein LOC110460348 [Mizuhopecten yessoensis]|uniref:uncharacterized protein LOC110460348 n=1 Tax=Mizuhopecten yessoensis TaxID=6573 RepID=UPI000B45E343|nr:uncharacterized protein LOC110460348 [Mizuhopecten yessoensis]